MSSVQIRTITDMTFTRSTANNQGKKGLVDADGIRVQIAENSREMWWMALNGGKVLPTSLAMPLEAVPDVTQVMFHYVNYFNANGKAHYFPTAGKIADTKQEVKIQFYTINREERGEISFILLAVGFTPAAVTAGYNNIENLKSLFSIALGDWINEGKAGQDLKKRFGGKLSLFNVLSDLWPLPEMIDKKLRDVGVTIYSAGLQSWTTQSHWSLDDNLLSEDAGPVLEDTPVVTGSVVVNQVADPAEKTQANVQPVDNGQPSEEELNAQFPPATNVPPAPPAPPEAPAE